MFPYSFNASTRPKWLEEALCSRVNCSSFLQSVAAITKLVTYMPVSKDQTRVRQNHSAAFIFHLHIQYFIFQFPDSFRQRQPRQSCLDSLPHSLVSSSPSSSPLSSSITLSLLAQYPPFQQILPTLILLLPWTAFTITGLDRTHHASRFIFSCFFFNFSDCPVWWTKLATHQLFTAR